MPRPGYSTLGRLLKTRLAAVAESGHRPARPPIRGTGYRPSSGWADAAAGFGAAGAGQTVPASSSPATTTSPALASTLEVTGPPSP